MERFLVISNDAIRSWRPGGRWKIHSSSGGGAVTVSTGATGGVDSRAGSVRGVTPLLVPLTAAGVVVGDKWVEACGDGSATASLICGVEARLLEAFDGGGGVAVVFGNGSAGSGGFEAAGLGLGCAGCRGGFAGAVGGVDCTGACPGGGGKGAMPTFFSAAAAAVATDAYFNSPAGLVGIGAGFIEEPFVTGKVDDVLSVDGAGIGDLTTCELDLRAAGSFGTDFEDSSSAILAVS